MMGQNEKHDNDRCINCKAHVLTLLEKVYGPIECKPKFNIGVRPDDFKNSEYYTNLKEIYNALIEECDGNNILSDRSHRLPRCDYFVRDYQFIVEFDESQHFTTPRRKSLELYPDNLQVRFSKSFWRDNSNGYGHYKQPYRDEIRAWYDTLRDFLPVINNDLEMLPTVRLFSENYKWCNLNPCDVEDRKKFSELIDVKPIGTKV